MVRIESRVAAPAGRVFAWHARPGAFERLTPPWQRVRLLSHEGIRDGGRAVAELRQGPFRRRWVAVHEDYEEGRRFADRQESGPFAHWRHVHRFEPDGTDGCRVIDEVEYRLPAGPLGAALGGPLARRTIERLLDFRHRRLAEDLARHEAAGLAPLRVALTGSSGLIGSALGAFLSTGGHEVVPLVRGRAGAGQVRWDPASGELDATGLEGCDAAIHLAGATISKRWTAERKREIADSRSRGTELFASALAGLERPPRVLVCASGIGYYGSRGDELLTEESSPGDDFIASVCRSWEAAAEPAAAAGIRVVNLRLGVILSAILPRMLPVFRLGLGGRLGSGRQWWSWLSLDDALGAFLHALATESLAGPVNVCAPGLVTNAELTRVLGRVLRRPAVLPVPAPALRVAFGELADGLLLASQRARPERLERSGFRFVRPELEGALRRELGG
ncbi:MAG: TIGR01777 family protein [Thermoleophilia bacterium]|nr:TIGR01777 family protein [Thermoleophilia bacterium]